jgi:hypothetical protein
MIKEATKGFEKADSKMVNKRFEKIPLTVQQQLFKFPLLPRQLQTTFIALECLAAIHPKGFLPI